MKAWIFMKSHVEVNCYLVKLSFKFHGDPCINAHAQVVSTSTCNKLCARTYTTRVDAGASIHEYS